MSSPNPLPPSAPASPEPDGYHAPLNFKQVQAEEEKVLRDDNAPRSALCISGGGIRSATFALGALQGLADRGILEHFDYLSTVSGGGYIGSWLTAWKHRRAGLQNILQELKSSAPPVPHGQLDPIGHLREYNNYLSPRLGLFSADTWTLVATVARNMLLNWLVFIPLLMFALMLPRIVLSLARLGETYQLWYVPGFDHWLMYLKYIIPILGGLFFAAGVFNVLHYLPGVGHKNHTQGEFLKYCLGPIFLAAVCFLTTDAWFTGGDKDNPPSITLTELYLWITLSGALGWVAYFVIYWKHVKEKLRALTSKREKAKWIIGLLVALLLTGLSTTCGGWLLVSDHFRHLSWPVYLTVALPLLLLSFALAVTIFVGFTSFVLGEEDREWLARGGAWLLLFVLTWAGICTLALLAPKWAFQLGIWAKSAFAAAGGIGGCLAALAGLSNKTKAQSKKNGTSQEKSGGLLDVVGKLAAPVFIVVFLTGLAILTSWILWKIGFVQGDWTDHYTFLENTHAESAVIFAVMCLGFSWLMARFININKFSLHAMYRSRLIRAYLGASNDDRNINNFIGFSDNDNLEMADLSSIPPDPCLKPFHIVNIALNLVSGERLAWQQRKAESFTVSPLHCGYDESYRPTRQYGGQGGISLGTAVTISGAAASPNMGYHSSPAMTFIMTLFNARLGAWLGNPKRERWREEGPRSAFDSIIREAFGLTNDSSPYVYLSDGGHFENLAMYEMLRRRCRYIVVLDGGADPDYSYEDLGNALRKIRIDENFTITFEKPVLLPLQKPQVRCAVAKIQYQGGATGELVYVKPVVLGTTEPPDVTAYKAANDAFPHQSTANQWFNESQTESYRMLGLTSIKDIFGQWGTKGFAGIVSDARSHLNPAPAAAAAAAGRTSP